MCNAYTKRAKKCSKHSGTLRLCPTHKKWYKDNLWLDYVIQHIDPNFDFEIISNILSDPFCIYYSNTILEEYLDREYLRSVNNLVMKGKILLLYDIACRTKKIVPSLCKHIWAYYIRVNIDIAISYHNSFLSQFHKDRFKYIILDTLVPFVFNESFNTFVQFIFVMLKNNIPSNTCITIIDYLIPYVNLNEYFYHEKTNTINHIINLYDTHLRNQNLYNMNINTQLSYAKNVFKHLIDCLKNKVHPIRNLTFKHELLDTVYHPDNVFKLIQFEFN